MLGRWRQPATGIEVTVLCRSIAKTAAGELRTGGHLRSSRKNWLIALGLVALGLGIAAAGIYIGDTDDAPGASLIGILLLIGAVTLAVRTIRRKT
jgi:hypothetical protein